MGDYMYEIEFISKDKLHWKCTKGDEKGTEADENYSNLRLNSHSLFISWMEEFKTA